MSTATRTPEFSQARVVKPFNGFESKYQGLDIFSNPIALPGTLDQFAGKDGYDANLLAGIPVSMGQKVLVWLPRFIPSSYGESVATNYRYRFVWRIRSLQEQVEDPSQEREGHFGRLLKGVAQEEYTGLDPNRTVLNPTAGPRVVIPTAFETVSIVNNKDVVANIAPVAEPDQYASIQKGTLVGGQPFSPAGQEPADVAVVSSRANTYIGEQYQAPISPNYPGPAGDKVGAAGMLSQGYYPDQAGWAESANPQNAAYAAGGQYLVYPTDVKGDELIILLDRPAGNPSNPTWDFNGLDRNVSRIFGTDAGTRQSIPSLGVYILTGSGVTDGPNFA